MSVRHGGVVMRIPEDAVLQGPPVQIRSPPVQIRSPPVQIRSPPVQTGSEPIRTDNFRPATITALENGNIKPPPSILPVVFGAGIALFIIYNAKKSGFGNFTFNF